jgi:hypothetical protein
MQQPRFSSAFLFMLSGLVVWAAHFMFIYGFVGLFCARPAWNVALLGFHLISFVVAVATLLGLAATLAIAVLALAGRGPSLEDPHGSHFYRFATTGGAALGAIGILWQGALPPLLLPACG